MNKTLVDAATEVERWFWESPLSFTVYTQASLPHQKVGTGPIRAVFEAPSGKRLSKQLFCPGESITFYWHQNAIWETDGVVLAKITRPVGRVRVTPGGNVNVFLPRDLRDPYTVWRMVKQMEPGRTETFTVPGAAGG